MNWLERFNRIPPALCALWARKNHGLKSKTLEDISQDSGMSLPRVKQIGKLMEWNSLPARTIHAFSWLGCGVNLERPSNHVRFFRRREAAYLRNCSASQRKRLLDIMRRIEEHHPI